MGRYSYEQQLQMVKDYLAAKEAPQAPQASQGPSGGRVNPPNYPKSMAGNSMSGALSEAEERQRQQEAEREEFISSLNFPQYETVEQTQAALTGYKEKNAGWVTDELSQQAYNDTIRRYEDQIRKIGLFEEGQARRAQQGESMSGNSMQVADAYRALMDEHAQSIARELSTEGARGERLLAAAGERPLPTHVGDATKSMAGNSMAEAESSREVGRLAQAVEGLDAEIANVNTQLDAQRTAAEYFTGYEDISDAELAEQKQLNQSLLAIGESTYNTEMAESARAALVAIEREEERRYSGSPGVDNLSARQEELLRQREAASQRLEGAEVRAEEYADKLNNETKWGEVLLNSGRKGLTIADQAIAKGLDFAVGGFLDEIHMLVGTTIQSFNPNYDFDERNWLTRYIDRGDAHIAAQNANIQAAANDNTAALKVADYATAIAQSAPSALFAILAAPAAATGAASTAALESISAIAQSSKAAQFVQPIAKASVEMMKNPQWLQSFLSTVGVSYEEALESGASEEDATIYAVTNAAFSASVEVGGTDEVLGGLQKLPSRYTEALSTGKGSLALEFLTSTGSEIGEEVTQGAGSEALKNVYTDVPFLWTNAEEGQSAVIDPERMKEEAETAAVVSAVLGGSQMVAQSVINAATKPQSTAPKSGEDIILEEAGITPEASTAPESESKYSPGVEEVLAMLGITDENGTPNKAPSEPQSATESTGDIPTAPTTAESDTGETGVLNTEPEASGGSTEERTPRKSKVRPRPRTEVEEEYELETDAEALANEYLARAEVEREAGFIEAAEEHERKAAELLSGKTAPKTAATAPAATATAPLSGEDIVLAEAGITPATEPVRVAESAETYSPAVGTGAERERGYSRSSRTDENTEAELREAIEADPETYRQLSNVDTAAKAEGIFAKGLDYARREVENALTLAASGRKTPPEIVPLTHLVTNALTKRGDIETARRLRAQLAVELTQAGQFGQAVRIMRRTDPATVRKAIGEAIRRINNEAGGRTRAKQEAADISEDMNIAVATGTQSLAQTLSKEPKVSRKKPRKTPEEEARPEEKNTDIVFTFEYADEAAKAISRAVEAKVKPKAARTKTAMETLVDSMKRYITAGIKSSGTRETPRTATELLADYAQNPEYYADAWNKALELLRTKYEGMSGTGMRELFASGVIERDGGAVLRRALAESAVATGENASYIRKQAALGISPENIANAIAGDLIGKTKADGAIAEAIREQATAYVDSILSKGQADSAHVVMAAMRDIGETLSNLALSAEKDRQTAKEAIAYLLSQKYALSPADAESIGRMVQDQLNSSVKAQAEKMLQSRYGAGTPKAKKTRPLVDRVVEAVNLGAFDSEFSKAAANKLFGLDKIKSGDWVAELTAEEEQLIANTDFTQEGAFEQVYNQIVDRLGAEMPAKTVEKLREVRKIFMLLNPKTQIKNVVGNIPMAGERKIANAISMGLQKLAVEFGLMRPEDVTRARATKETKQLAREYFETHKQEILGGASKSDLKGVLKDHRLYFNDGITGWVQENLLFLPRDSFDKVRKFTYKLLESGDSPFVRSAFVDSLSQYMAAQGITSAENIPQAAIDKAKADAYEATYKAASALATYLNKIKSAGFVGEVVDIYQPFTTTLINATKQLVRYSPVGVVEGAIKLSKSDSETRAAAIDVLAQGLSGSGVIVLGILLKTLGAITGAADDDKDKAALDRATGEAPFTVRTDAALEKIFPDAENLPDANFTYSGLQPLGSQLAMGADLADAIAESDGVLDAIVSSAAAGGDALFSTDFLSNVLALFQNYNNEGVTEKLFREFVEGEVTQLIPSAIAATARTIDPTVRSTYTGGGFWENLGANIKSRIPGLSDDLPASINVRGEENTRGTKGASAFENFLLPANISRGDRTAVDDEIYRLMDETGSKTHFPSVSPYKVEYDGESYTMTGEERERFQTTQGQTYYELAGGLLETPAYKNASAEVQREILEAVRDYSLAAAKNEFLAGKGETYEWGSRTQENLSILDNPEAYLAAVASAEAAQERRGLEFDPHSTDAFKLYIEAGLSNADLERLSENLSDTQRNIFSGLTSTLGVNLAREVYPYVDSTTTDAKQAVQISGLEGLSETQKMQVLMSYLPADSKDGSIPTEVLRYQYAAKNDFGFDAWAAFMEQVIADEAQYGDNDGKLEKAEVQGTASRMGYSPDVMWDIHYNASKNTDKTDESAIKPQTPKVSKGYRYSPGDAYRLLGIE